MAVKIRMMAGTLSSMLHDAYVSQLAFGKDPIPSECIVEVTIEHGKRVVLQLLDPETEEVLVTQQRSS